MQQFLSDFNDRTPFAAPALANRSDAMIVCIAPTLTVATHLLLASFCTFLESGFLVFCTTERDCQPPSIFVPSPPFNCYGTYYLVLKIGRRVKNIIFDQEMKFTLISVVKSRWEFPRLYSVDIRTSPGTLNRAYIVLSVDLLWCWVVFNLYYDHPLVCVGGIRQLSESFNELLLKDIFRSWRFLPFIRYTTNRTG